MDSRLDNPGRAAGSVRGVQREELWDQSPSPLQYCKCGRLKPTRAAVHGSALMLPWSDFGWREACVVKCELLDFALS